MTQADDTEIERTHESFIFTQYIFYSLIYFGFHLCMLSSKDRDYKDEG